MNEKRILVVANETVGGEALRESIEKQAAGFETEVFVVSPALNSRIRHWLSDVDQARQEAAERLRASLAALGDLGIQADGRVGDADPIQAIEDALRSFVADEIIISTHPRGRSNWLVRGVIERACARFDLPVSHVVVDLEHESLTHTPA